MKRFAVSAQRPIRGRSSYACRGIAAVVFCLAFAYDPALDYRVILFPLALVFALSGHILMFKTVKYCWCRGCNAEKEVVAQSGNEHGNLVIKERVND